MKILLLSATLKEIQPTIDFLEQNSTQKTIRQFTYKNLEIIPYITGVGSPMVAYALGRYENFTTDYRVIHAGISGTYSSDILLGSVVEVIQERWADMGAENPDGSLTDLFELGLCDWNQKPFIHGCIEKKNNLFATHLKQCLGLTLNKGSGNLESIKHIRNKYKAEVESMEGAAVFYGCRMRDVPFVSIRGISNWVEERNTKNWNIELAIHELNKYLLSFISTIL